MSTRKRTKRGGNRADEPALSTGNVQSKDDLPPPRERKGLRPVSPPGSNISFRTFIHILTLVGIAILLFYCRQIWLWKKDVGGWWNLAMGRRAPVAHTGPSYDAGNEAKWVGRDGGNGAVEVENQIERLASALGMPSKELASAIAGAVREYVPPASLSSISAQAKQTGKGSGIVQELVGTPIGEQGNAAEAVTGTVADTIDKIVGMDEPPDLNM